MFLPQGHQKTVTKNIVSNYAHNSSAYLLAVHFGFLLTSISFPNLIYNFAAQGQALAL